MPKVSDPPRQIAVITIRKNGRSIFNIVEVDVGASDEAKAAAVAEGVARTNEWWLKEKIV